MGSQSPIPIDPCFTIESFGDVTVVTFTTDALINLVELERIGHTLYALADQTLDRARGKLVLDFQKVRYFASQAVGILLTLNRKLGRASAFTVCGVGPQLGQVLGITRLDQVLNIAATAEEAVRT